MPKALNIKKISAASVEAAEICRIMDEAHIEFVQVDNHCWAADFPYKPKFEVRMAHNGSQLLINYRVTEECVRAVAPHDDGNVWEDSCCELFLSPVADGTYYNMECNAHCSSVSVPVVRDASVLSRLFWTRCSAGRQWVASRSTTLRVSVHGSCVWLCPLRLTIVIILRASTACT